MTPTIAKTMPDLGILREKAKACSDSSLKLSRERLWLFIASDVPAKRSDWGQLRVVKRRDKLEPTENGIVVNGKNVTLVLNVYKTAGTHNEHNEELPEIVAEEVRASLNLFPRRYLFGLRHEDTPFKTNDSFGMWAKDVLNKHLGTQSVTLNGLRKAWAAEHGNPGTATIAKREELARKMLHTERTQQMSYVFVPQAPT